MGRRKSNNKSADSFAFDEPDHEEVPVEVKRSANPSSASKHRPSFSSPAHAPSHSATKPSRASNNNIAHATPNNKKELPAAVTPASSKKVTQTPSSSNAIPRSSSRHAAASPSPATNASQTTRTRLTQQGLTPPRLGGNHTPRPTSFPHSTSAVPRVTSPPIESESPTNAWEAVLKKGDQVGKIVAAPIESVGKPFQLIQALSPQKQQSSHSRTSRGGRESSKKRTASASPTRSEAEGEEEDNEEGQDAKPLSAHMKKKQKLENPTPAERRSSRHANSPRKSMKEVSTDEDEDEEEGSESSDDDEDVDMTASRSRKSTSTSRRSVSFSPMRRMITAARASFSSPSPAASPQTSPVKKAAPLSAEEQAKQDEGMQKMDKLRKFFEDLDAQPINQLTDVIRR